MSQLIKPISKSINCWMFKQNATNKNDKWDLAYNIKVLIIKRTQMLAHYMGQGMKSLRLFSI